LKKNESGQVLILILGITAMLMLSLVVMIHLGQVTTAKIKLQNMADASALAIATYQARGLNVMADLNAALVDNGIDVIETSIWPGRFYVKQYVALIEGIQYAQDTAHLAHGPDLFYPAGVEYAVQDSLVKIEKMTISPSSFDNPLDLHRKNISMYYCDPEIPRDVLKAKIPIYYYYDINNKPVRYGYMWPYPEGTVHTGKIVSVSRPGWMERGAIPVYVRVELSYPAQEIMKGGSILGINVPPVYAVAQAGPVNGSIWLPDANYDAVLIPITNEPGVLH